jgi:hypothetical protein
MPWERKGTECNVCMQRVLRVIGEFIQCMCEASCRPVDLSGTLVTLVISTAVKVVTLVISTAVKVVTLVISTAVKV